MKSTKKFEILSAQKWKEYYAIQVVYEWEDVLGATLGIPLDMDSQPLMNKIFNKPANSFLQKFIRNSFLKKYIDISFNYLLRKKKGIYFVSFQLYVIEMVNHYVYQPNSIPIFIDCFRSMVDRIPALCEKNPMFFVTDYEVYQQLQKTNAAKKTRFVSLSISDKYLRKEVPEKKIDVLQMGRQNPVLHEWMLQLTQKHPNVEYVYAHKKDEVHSYYSTTRGWLAEDTDTREAFMKFLGSARISLLSSPGIDGGDKTRTGGYNPVTPRFYESAINYCYLVGRFPDTPDFIYNKVSSVCERPQDYESFETLVLDMLSKPFSQQEKYEAFIQDHLTSTISNLIKKELETL